MTMNEGFSEKEVLLLRRKLDLLLRTGKMLMESAADTNRIDRNMKRVAAFMGIPEDKLHIDIRWTIIMVNVSDEKHSFSKFQKCEKHGVNMTVISQISDLSWKAIEEDYSLDRYEEEIEEDYSLDRYEEELEKIAKAPRNYKPWLVAVCAGFACGGFCKLFGGDWVAFFLASLCAYAGFHVRAQCIKFGINHYMCMAIAAFVATCLAYGTTLFGWSATPYHPLLACALFIVPGVPLINFVDDMIDNFLLVGITRAANTAMMLGALTFGIAFALRIFQMSDVQIDLKFSELSMEPHDSYYVYAIAAAIAAMGFSMIFNIQRRLLWVVGRVHAELRKFRLRLRAGHRVVYGKFRSQSHRGESRTLVSRTESRADHTVSYPDDSRRFDVSFATGIHQYARRDRRSNTCIRQWNQFGSHHPMHLPRSSRPEHLRPSLHRQRPATVLGRRIEEEEGEGEVY